MSHPNESAFPFAVPYSPGNSAVGLSKREYFAAQVLGDILSDELWKDNLAFVGVTRGESFERIALIAVEAADKLIAALNRDTETISHM